MLLCLDEKKLASLSSCLIKESVLHLLLVCCFGSSSLLASIFTSSLLFIALLRLPQPKTYPWKPLRGGRMIRLAST